MSTAPNTPMPEYKVQTSQLRIGVFICLERNWLKHPFFFNKFKITKEEQIRTIREVGIKEVICIPEKSDVLPLALEKSALETKVVQQVQESRETQAMWEQKRERIERLRVRQEVDAQCEKRFEKSITAVKNIMSNIEAGSQEAFEESDGLMRDIATSLLPNRESAVQLMNTKLGKENVFFHSLNVAVLSMMLAREYKLDADSMRVVGLGGLFHDIGKSRIPKNLLTKKESELSRAELKFRHLHPKYGVDVLTQLHKFPGEALKAVYQHHEHADGQGYPLGLKGKEISLIARIVAIADVYDNHCNALHVKDSITPHMALAHMFSAQKSQFDMGLLTLFIQCLGVYPPGTIVTLSNGFTGMVTSVNPRDPLHPSLVLYNPDIPKKDALIFDMIDDPSVKIESSIKPSQLPDEVYEYLSPRTRITYYVADPGAAPAPVKPPGANN